MEEREVNKVRAVILNEKGQILVAKTQEGVYMLPGGKIEKGERIEEALQREILEESGIALSKEEIKGQFYNGIHYAHKIDEVTNEKYMKKTNTDFLLAYTDKQIDEKKLLCQNEKKQGDKNQSILILVF